MSADEKKNLKESGDAPDSNGSNPPDKPAPEPAKLPIAVVVNDNPTQLSVLSEMLRKAGLEPLAFTGAEAALAAMSEGARSGGASDAPPAIIVTDLYMPGLDGWRFCRLLRSPEYAAFNQVPILVVSATFAGDDASRIAADLGAEAFLASPVDGQRFCEQVRAILSGERVRTPLRVLIVDDNDSLCDLLKRVFTAHGYQVDTALTFQAAAEAFRKSSYDVAVLDYYLPDGLGDALLDAFRAERPDCVCLMMTSNNGPDMALDLMKRGAAAFLQKPFKTEYLIELCARARRERALLRTEELLEVRTRELRESESHYRELVEGMPCIVYTYSTKRGSVYCSSHAMNLLGYSPEQLYAQPLLWHDSIHPDDCQRIEQVVRETGAGKQFRVEYRIRNAHGNWRWFDDLSFGYKLDGPDVTIKGLALDITERKRVETALRESEARFRAMFEYAIDGIFQSTVEGKALAANPAFVRMLGYASEEDVLNTLIDLPHGLWAHPEERAIVRRLIAEQGYVRGYECEFLRKDGKKILISLNATAVRGPDGQASYFHGSIEDITERKRAETALRESEARAKAMLQAIPDLMFRLDRQGVFLDYKANIRDLYDQSESTIIGKRNRDISPPEFADLIDRQIRITLETGKMQAFEYQLPLPGRGVRDYEARMVASGADEVTAIVRDVTERKRADSEQAKLEVQNWQLQKSESLRRMAGAIAHHFNNQLQGVLMNLEFAMGSQSSGEFPTENLIDAMESARKAAEVSSLMLTYLGQTHCKLEVLDLSDVCQRHLPILRAAMPQCVVLDSDLPALGPVISANANQMQQVLTNLVTNAWESSGDRTGSIRLTVKTASPSNIATAHRFPIDFHLQHNAYACLEVADTGCGITSQDIGKLFEPFFSTKFTGRGLGLPVVLGIVRAHSGVVTVESESGRGSIFRVFLPISQEAVPPKPVQVAQIARTAGGGTVLVVDDEIGLRKVVVTAIKRLGFKVLDARDGVEALEVFRQHQDEIRLVLCDLSMPRMDGWQTLSALRKLAPDIPVILASGYREAQVMAGDHPELPQAFLSKPYEFEKLRDVVFQVLTKGKR